MKLRCIPTHFCSHVARTLNISPQRVIGTFFVDACNAIKISIDRPNISASIDERDVFGTEQQSAIECMHIPIFAAALTPRFDVLKLEPSIRSIGTTKEFLMLKIVTSIAVAGVLAATASISAFCGGQAAFGSGHCAAVHHELTGFGDHRIQFAGVGIRYRGAYSSAARIDRRTRELCAPPRAVFPCKRKLRHLGLCRALRTGLALWPRRPCLWLSADPWRDRGPGCHRFTARIHGEPEASATIEAGARPELGRDWSLDLNSGDGFRWSEPPVLHVLGRENSAG